MVVPTDIQIAFTAGAFMADAGARIITMAKQESEEKLNNLYAKHRLRTFIFTAVFLAPVATISLLGWTAWETQYLSERFVLTAGNPVNASYYGVFLGVVVIAGWFGNWLGFRWVLSGNRMRLRVLYILLMIATFGFVFLRWPAPVRVGSYSEFYRDPSALPYMWDYPVFYATFWVLMLLVAIPLIWWFIDIRRSVKEIAGAA